MRVADRRAAFLLVIWAARAAFGGPAQYKSSAAQTDTQAWSEVDLTAPVTREISLTSESIARASVHDEHWVMAANGLFAETAVNANLTVAAFYSEYDTYKETQQAWFHTSEPGWDVTLNGSRGLCQLSDRSRWYYILGEATHQWVYRNRPRVECEVAPASWGLSGYVSDELFHYSAFGRMTRQRWMAGTQTMLGRHASIDVYYLRQNDTLQKPNRINGFGITLMLRPFKPN